jgi:ribosomal protein S18 acetylase RimI-like enzyme
MLFATVAGAEEADPLYAILSERTAWLAERGIAQWPSPYPRDLFDADIANGWVLVLRREGSRLVGTATVYPRAPAYYPRELPPDAFARYICRLAVGVAFQGQQLGREALRLLAADQASRGARRLRLDVVAANPFLERYYRASGFEVILRAPISGTPSLFMQRDLSTLDTPCP